MSRPPLPEKTRRAQDTASDPAVSAWVTANAGAGKTTVLVRRAIRLMMAGVPPARILCLTYTKAAAAHMANEVLRVLSDWVRLDDQALDAKLAEVDPAPISDLRRARARRLFTAALETPGGLKVQTIHAFCDRVLHQFPFEARVPAGFEVLDEVSEKDLLARARLAVLLEAAFAPAGPLGQALARAVEVASDQNLAQALDAAVRERRRLTRFLDRFGGAGADHALAAALGIETRETLAAVESKIIEKALLPRSEWSNVAATLAALGGNAKRRGETLAAAALMSYLTAALDEYLSVFFTNDGDPREEAGFGGENARRLQPVLFARMIAERDRLIPLIDKRAAAAARERSAALTALAEATVRRYQAMKTARGVLDFGDLVAKTVDLLTDTAAAWVHYKLDSGVDHILIDEAQDTSPEQWTLIEKLAEEFFAGRGAREDRPRTIFAVGDEKQSIFSFQGAEPARFDAMQRNFKQRAGRVARSFQSEELTLSFRSMRGVLAAIDTVFERREAHAGLTSRKDGKTIHEAIRTEAPALVEIWPTEKPAAEVDADEIAWDAPFDARAESSPPVVLAQRIARAVRSWIGGGFAVTDRRTGATRGARPGDVIVLVRRRGVLFEAILRALKSAGIPVAGADRLDLVDHIAVMDFLALADALLLEHDDLALACALKSPLFDLSEDDLFELAHGRQGTLAAALAEKEKSNSRFAEAAGLLANWREEARRLRPFDFLSRVLGRDHGRERMLGRLGTEAADAIDELLARSLAYERNEAPSLTGFVAFLRRAGTEVKRDLEIESEAVRVMTVHGVKGLEAPIVVVADTTGAPSDGRHDPKLLALAVPNSPPDTPEALLWALGSKSDSRKLAEAREAARHAREAEYRRLLYVALTRAADALVVCGCDSKDQDELKLPPGCWYRLVYDALREGCEEQKTPYADKVWRWRPEALRTAPDERAPAEAKTAAPDWLGANAPAARPRRRLITPSLASVELGLKRASAGGAPVIEARRRGELIHKLLQLLAGVGAAERGDRALRFLAASAGELPEAQRGALADEAMAVLGHADCAILFGENSRAEVPVIARLDAAAGPIEIFGRIDRLVESADGVRFADFKTDRPPPASAAAAPAHYLEQLALYRAALAPLYRGKSIRALLVWTALPRIDAVPGPLLDAAYQCAIGRLEAP